MSTADALVVAMVDRRDLYGAQQPPWPLPALFLNLDDAQASDEAREVEKEDSKRHSHGRRQSRRDGTTGGAHGERQRYK